MLLRLRPLLDNFCGNSHSTGRNFSQACGQHMHPSFAIIAQLLRRKLRLHTFICDEEQRRPRRRPYYHRANAIVDASKAARSPEAGGGLQASLEGVEGVERGVDCCACYSACLSTLVFDAVVWLVEVCTRSERRYGESTKACLCSFSILMRESRSRAVHHNNWISLPLVVQRS